MSKTILSIKFTVPQGWHDSGDKQFRFIFFCKFICWVPDAVPYEAKRDLGNVANLMNNL